MRESIALTEARRAFETYVQVRTAHGYKAPLTPAEIQHSALLQRLLSGKEPLEKPPPRSFSYPWYELGENGTATAMQVKELPMFARHKILINQSDQYEILEYPQPNHFIVRCTSNDDVYRVFPEDGQITWYPKIRRWRGRVHWRIILADRYDDTPFPPERLAEIRALRVEASEGLEKSMADLMGKLAEGIDNAR